MACCYFPIAFTPPPHDTRGITRLDLVEALQAAMGATPAFAKHAVREPRSHVFPV